VRIVFDPNAFVSAVIANGVSRHLFDLWREHRQFELVVCPLLLEELSEVLQRARFRAVIASEEVDALVTFLGNEALLVNDPTDIPTVSRDLDDDYLVALATREEAAFIVSGDRDLLELDVPGITLLRPGEALARLSSLD
jgi:uncharacterized protein